MTSNDSQIDKPQCGCPKRAELPDVNINTGMQSINTERAFSIAAERDMVFCQRNSVRLLSMLSPCIYES